MEDRNLVQMGKAFEIEELEDRLEFMVIFEWLQKLLGIEPADLPPGVK